MARLNYISNAEFVPMSMQNLLVPLTLYKEAFEKSEAEYKDLTTKSGAFAYLSQMAPEGSKARAIYEKYANDLKMQADDIAQNGLSMSNRSALTSLGQRYSSEIGMLETAQKAMDEHKKTWMAQRANDPSMLFATNTFNLDDYLFGATPNMYSVSGDSLYKKGVNLGTAASSRIFRAGDGGNTLGGYYKAYIQTYGYNPTAIAKFREDMSAIPELRQGVMDILYANGVPQNLSEEDYRRAEQQVLNGVIDGAVYKEQHELHRDPNMLTPTERQSMALAAAQENRARAKFLMDVQDWQDQRNLLYEFDDNGNIIGYKSSNSLEDAGYVQDPRTGKWIRDWSKSGSKGNSPKGGNSSGKGGNKNTEYVTQGKQRLVLTWESGNPNTEEEYRKGTNIKEEYVPDDETSHIGNPIAFKNLPEWAKEVARMKIGRGKADMYDYYFEDYHDNWGPWNRHAKLEIVPRDLHVDDKTDFSVLEELDN